MIGRVRYPYLFAALAVACAEVTAQPLLAQAAAAVPASLAGTYDGGQIEVAAGLELGTDGRFRYMLAYGALDEAAEGVWRFEGGQVLLTSDPIAAPRFVLLDRHPAPGGRLRIALALPEGMSPQYFEVESRHADGRVSAQQFGDDSGSLDLDPGDRPIAVVVTLPIVDLRSEPVEVTGAGGAAIRFRFEPRDLGKVAFARTPLRIDDGDLVLTRHDLTLRFRRTRR